VRYTAFGNGLYNSQPEINFRERRSAMSTFWNILLAILIPLFGYGIFKWLF